MCYDAEAQLTRQLKDAYASGAPSEEIEKLYRRLMDIIIERQLEEQKSPGRFPDDSTAFDVNLLNPDDLPIYYHVNGWSHPSFVILTDAQAPTYDIAEWGFVPPWVKTLDEAHDFKKPYNNNLNAQSETMFEKKGFRNAAHKKRCVVSLDAYYEHHHTKGKTYPFRVAHKDGTPLWVAGIYEDNVLVDTRTGEEIRKKTIAFLTCRASKTLARIHNNPKVIQRSGPRMLVLLDDTQIEDFMQPYPEGDDPAILKMFEESIKHFCQPYDEDRLEFRSVRNLRDRKDLPSPGNVPEIRDEYRWAELDYDKILG